MKVIIVPSWYPTEENPINGIFFKEQARAIKKFGYEVTVLYPEIRTIRMYSNDWEKGIKIKVEDGLTTYRYKGYNFIPARIPFATAFIYYRMLKNLYNEMVKREGKPDVIHAHSCLWGGWAAAKIAQEENIPLVITEHSSKLIRGLIKPYEKKEIIKTLNQTDKVISVGPSLKEELAKYTDKNVYEIPNIVDCESFQNINNNSLSKSKRFRFFSLAFLTPNKGMDVLLKSFAKAFKNKDVELLIGGEGEQKEKLKGLTQDLGLEPQIEFLGALDRKQVIQQMHECDAFILASRFETFGVVFIEALASGKPIIATKCGGPDSIVNEKNGLMVPVDDIDKLSNAMIKMYNNYSIYNPVDIRNDCLARFSEEVIIGKILEVYNSIV
ncbi:glycosyltransferase [Neobacillus drentensis]|uniref:glycosyltransferase n=1 Tax=Neobacillus drentensis TaxID=220684 RepID=UPI00300053DC